MLERLRNQSLRTKLVGVFLLPTLLIVLLYGLLAYFSARQGLEDELGKRLVSVGQAVSAELSDGFAAKQIVRLDADKNRVRERLRARLRTIRDATGVRRMYIFDRKMRNLVDTDGPSEFGATIYKLEADRFEIDRAFEGGEATTSVLFEGKQGTLYKSAYVPITLGDEVIASLAVEASAEYFGLLRNFASILTVLGGVGIALVVLAGTLFARAITEPVNRLVEAARRLGEGDLEEPVTDLEQTSEGGRQNDEIAFLARSFEEMRRDILGRDRQMRMMLSGIAHEVRNPLGGMKLFCGLLEEDLQEDEAAGSDRGQELEKVRKIAREVSYLERVVDEFRDFARQTPLERERIDAREMCRELRHLMAGDVREAGCRLDLSIPEGLELTADPDRLRRVLLNLVRNAYQACRADEDDEADEASETGGVVEVSVEAPTDDRRVITVRDNGPGIPEEVLREMVTPFFTTKEKGSGLGLPLSKQIIEQHGGRLEIDTAPGEGTEVRIELPFDPEIQACEPEVPEGWLG